MAPRIPVTVLTGSLGSGKTTLLNRILGEPHGQRIAVIEREPGEIGIDQALVIRTDEEVLEMNNGCICCTVRGDLIRALGHLRKGRDRFDRVVVEIAGMASPGPVAQTFFADEEVQVDFRLDGIVTLVDAVHLELHLGEQAEAFEQVAFADVLVIHKVDLVDELQLAEIERRIRGINTMATVLRGSHGQIPLDQVLDVGGFDLERALALRPALPDPAAPSGSAGSPELGAGAPGLPVSPGPVSSVSLEFDRPFDGQRLDAWLIRLLCEHGHDIFRMKGILSIAGSDRRFVFQGVHMLFDGRPDRPWGDTPPASQVVFIGKRLDRAALREGLTACLA